MNNTLHNTQANSLNGSRAQTTYAKHEAETQGPKNSEPPRMLLDYQQNSTETEAIVTERNYE